MTWKIDHQCPQCGGPVSLEETDRFFICNFCRVRLYITSSGPFQYCLAPKNKTEEMLYIPYWRFKGTAFSVRGVSLNHRILDVTRIAAPSIHLPNSLGVRPQALNLQFATGKTGGKFVKQTVPLSQVLSDTENQLSELGVDVAARDTILKGYVGETVSIIYAPFTKKGGIMQDAILAKYTYKLDQAAQAFLDQAADDWSPKFLPAMCPSCGWDLTGERESCVFICGNCSKAWATTSDSLTEVKMGARVKRDDNVTYIPFWKITPDITGAKLSSYADLVRFANLPKVVQPKWETIPLVFWVPAFKIVPNVFLRLGGMLTISPAENISYDNLKLTSMYPVTLPAKEAIEGQKLIFASLVVSKRKNFAKLPGIKISAQETELIFLPFVCRGSELIYEEQNIAIQNVALAYGKNF